MHYVSSWRCFVDYEIPHFHLQIVPTICYKGIVHWYVCNRSTHFVKDRFSIK